MNAPLRYSRITSTNPDRLTKTFYFDASDTVQRQSAGNMIEGHANDASARDLHELAQHLDALAPNQAIAWGLSARDDVALVVKDERCNGPGALARCREDFSFAPGPGVMMLDHDGVRPGEPGMSAELLLATLHAACPHLADAPTLVRPSASAGIADDNGVIHYPLSRWRVYIAVGDAQGIPEAGKRLLRRLDAFGAAWAEVTTKGAVVDRWILDASVWQPEKLDFAAAPILAPGLRRIAPAARVMNAGAPLFDLNLIVAGPTLIARAEAVRAHERAAVEPERQRRRDLYVALEAARLATARGVQWAGEDHLSKAAGGILRISRHRGQPFHGIADSVSRQGGHRFTLIADSVSA